MISCTDFIPAYSELFTFLEEKKGKEDVIRFWHYLSDTFLDNLKAVVRKKEIAGCWSYWSKTLNEEAAAFTMELDTRTGVFKGTLHRCPSKGRLLKLKHFKAYKDYCGHCDVLYRRVLEPLGLEYVFNDSEVDRARCSIVVREKQPGKSATRPAARRAARPRRQKKGKS